VRAALPVKLPRPLLAGALAVGLAIAAAACGTGGYVKGGDVTKGKQLFNTVVDAGHGQKYACSTCHTLAAAGAAGTIGPNLDNAFSADRQQGFPESTIRQMVHDQIEIPSPPMPANLVKGADAADVAAFVAKCAAATTCTGLATGPPPGSGPGGKLYVSLGCQSCHSLDGSKNTGPTFKGLYGSKVKLTGGKTVTANMAYLIESIINPDKQIVQSYSPGIMSATIKPHSVSLANAKALVQFIKSLK
jgi:cytochrome c2